MTGRDTVGDIKTEFPLLKAPVIPVLIRPDGSYDNDSTPLILQLEAAFLDRSLATS